MTSDTDDQTTAKTPAEKLAEILARRKANAGQNLPGGASGGRRQQERAAAAQSASKSKPALRK